MRRPNRFVVGSILVVWTGLISITHSSEKDELHPYLTPPAPSLPDFASSTSNKLDVISAILKQNFTLEGAKLTPGPHATTPAFHFDSEQGGANAALSGVPLRHWLSQISSGSHNRELAVLLSVRQIAGNSGAILMLTDENQHGESRRLFELQSSGRQDVLRVHYHKHHHTLQHKFHGDPSFYHPRMEVISVPAKVADGQWHRMAIVLSGKMLQVFLDCKSVFKKVILPLDFRLLSLGNSNLTLWLGRHQTRNLMHFKGFIQNVNLISGRADAHQLQCPNLAASCPTCGEFQALQDVVEEIRMKFEREIQTLRDQLASTEARLASVEECDCRKSCRSDLGIVREDGASWSEGCQLCSCVQGKITCRPPKCPVLNCTDPNPPDPSKGLCCPTCKAECRAFGAKVVQHGTSFKPHRCAECHCNDGRLHCTNQRHCPKLDCPIEEQIQEEGECCKVCRGDPCEKGKEVCNGNATCISGLFDFTCSCKEGFKGDGILNCDDINECEVVGGANGHHCNAPNSVCINLPGSYDCQCIKGYESVDANQLTCEPIDACSKTNDMNELGCHLNSTCVSTGPGIYDCICKEGFVGNGFQECSPVCPGGCDNGGVCVAPGECQCSKGFTGARCETDIDECASNLHVCGEHSLCVNKPGWYHCQCDEGYFAYEDPLVSEPMDRLACVDIDECQLGLHSCPDHLQCTNQEGSYTCQCKDEEEHCDTVCHSNGFVYENGQTWEFQCQRCECQSGRVVCREPSSCSDCQQLAHNNTQCCPNCSPLINQDRLDSCSVNLGQKQETFQSGQRWLHHCQECECKHGEVDCWPISCPPCHLRSCNSHSGGAIRSATSCCPPCPLEHQPVPCHFNEKKFNDGESWLLETDSTNCTVCQCKDGFVYCSTGDSCSVTSNIDQSLNHDGL